MAYANPQQAYNQQPPQQGYGQPPQQSAPQQSGPSLPPDVAQELQKMQSGQYPYFNSVRMVGQIQKLSDRRPNGWEYKETQNNNRTTKRIRLDIVLVNTYQDGQGQWQERFQKITAQAFGATANALNQKLGAAQVGPGAIVYLEGRMRVARYQKKNGQQAGQWDTDASVDIQPDRSGENFQILGNMQVKAQPPSQGQGGYQGYQQPPAQQGYSQGYQQPQGQPQGQPQWQPPQQPQQQPQWQQPQQPPQAPPQQPQGQPQWQPPQYAPQGPQGSQGYQQPPQSPQNYQGGAPQSGQPHGTFQPPQQTQRPQGNNMVTQPSQSPAGGMSNLDASDIPF